MAARGIASGNGNTAVVVGVLLVCAFLHAGVAESAEFIVGDGGGWSVNASSWANAKRFLGRDVLVFNYDPTALDVVKVSASEYEACAAPSGAKVLKSGADRVALALGPSYFICSVPAQCQAGIKMAVVARKQGRIGGAS
ncbi:basic blue protein-like [Triticum dicoccoides]|uniref:basic blue protein-like n=1 Tax=Triticum dicoccoides TaxID=85692 RepID=UPI00188E113D|nr:basic blue protein-like [Triticum dicoccoides]